MQLTLQMPAQNSGRKRACVARLFRSHSFIASPGREDLASAMTSGWLIAGQAFAAPLPGCPAIGVTGYCLLCAATMMLFGLAMRKARAIKK